MSSSGISWVMCKSAPRSRQITTPAPNHSVFYRPDALPTAQPTASEHCRPNIKISKYFFNYLSKFFWLWHLICVLLVFCSICHIQLPESVLWISRRRKFYHGRALRQADQVIIFAVSYSQLCKKYGQSVTKKGGTMLLLVTLHTDALHIIFTLIFGIFNPILTIRMCVNVRMFLLVPAHPGSPGQGSDKRFCACVCVCVFVCLCVCVRHVIQ